MTMLRRLVWASGTAAVTWVLAGAVAAAAQNRTPASDAPDPRSGEVAFRIAAQPIDGALKEFASQANLQLIYETTEVNPEIRSPHVAGAFTPEAALTRLLARTNLGYKFINNRTVSIRSASADRSDDHFNAVSDGGATAAPPDHLSDSNEGPTEPKATAEYNARNDGPRKELAEVVVTAQKREERLIDVPISIVAVGSNELQQRQITSLEDLPSAVPNLAYSNTGNNHFFEIRGISNLTGSASLIGLYIDEADVTLGGAVATQVNPVAYDLERVEVLRGPQGTLYGEGSAGGTIRFITKNPNLRSFSFDSQVTALFTEGGGPSQRIYAVANVPLIDNELGLRITGVSEHDGGWIDQAAADQKQINAQDLTNIRIKGLWQPDPRLTVSAMVVVNRNSRSTDTSDSSTPTAWTQALNLSTTPRIRSDYELYNLTTTYQVLPSARLLNTTTYLKASAPMWNQGFSYQFSPPEMAAPRYDFYVPLQQTVDRLLTDELRLTSIDSGPWQWTVGGFYRHYRDTSEAAVNYFDVAGPPGTPLSAYFQYPFGLGTLYESWSAFGDTSYRFGDRLTAGAGVRYFREKQDFTDFALVTKQSARFHSADPRAYAQFKLTPGFNVYASVAEGFRSGGFNGFNQPVYGPESVWTYEFGAKMLSQEGRLSLDAAVFWSNYADFQTNGIVADSATTYIVDAGRARIKGLEWNFAWHPSEKWQFDLRGDYLNARFTQVNATFTAYNAGDPLDLVPRYQLSVSGQRDYSWLGKQGFIRLDYSQQGPQTSRNRSIGDWYYGESDVIQLLSFRASLTLKDNLRAGFFAQNLLNDQGFANPFNYIANGVRPRPRTYGIDFNVTFD